MEQLIKVGSYCLSFEQVEIYLKTNYAGGYFCFNNPEAQSAQIILGTDCKTFADFYDVILHEAFEFVALRMETGLRPVLQSADDVTNRVFVMTHAQMGEILSRVGWFLAQALEDITNKWKEIKDAENTNRPRTIRPKRTNKRTCNNKNRKHRKGDARTRGIRVEN